MDNSNLGLIIQENGLEYLGRYYSTYRAIVINNNDELNMNRVHVYIPSVQNGIKIWALPKSTTIGGCFHGFLRYFVNRNPRRQQERTVCGGLQL